MKTELIQSAISKSELLDIYLSESKITRDNNFVLDVDLKDIKQQNRREAQVEVLELDKNKATPETTTPYLLKCIISFGSRFIKENTQQENQQQVLAELEASFCAVYQCTEQLSDDELKEFVSFNVVHNVWPFWREHAFRLAAEAKLPRPTIPLLRPKS